MSQGRRIAIVFVVFWVVFLGLLGSRDWAEYKMCRKFCRSSSVEDQAWGSCQCANGDYYKKP